MGRAGWANARLLALSDKERKRRMMVVMVRVSGVDIGAGSEREDVWGMHVSINRTVIFFYLLIWDYYYRFQII
jgi:hypothetical protein